MKRILCSLMFILLFCNYIAICDNVNKNTATDVALNFFNSSQPDKINTVDTVIEEMQNDTVLYYTVYFKERGFAFLSADDNIEPVLGYSLNSNVNINTLKPPALEWLLKNFKKQIIKVKRHKVNNNEAKDKWRNLQEHKSSSRLKSANNYAVNTVLLNTLDGWVAWGQTRNNSGGCMPRYNMDIEDVCPSGDGCGFCDAGCGAVAMGQIMWYWRWPNSVLSALPFVSDFYDWDIMDPELYENSDPAYIDRASEVAKLLKDCGHAADMAYWFSGSWTQLSDLVDGLIIMGYSNVSVVDKITHMVQIPAIVKNEIDNERPVIFEGGNGLFPTHYFICDGYNSDENFHFNFGWNGAYNGYYFNIYHIYDPGDGDDFDNEQSIVINIQPDCGILNSDLSVGQGSLITFANFQARDNIISPITGQPATVESGAKLILTAGNSITLKPGFWAKSGSTFKTKMWSCGSHRAVSQDQIYYGKKGEISNSNSILADDLNIKIKQEKIYNGISIFPNPGNGIYNVNNLPGNCNLKVYNLEGSLIQEFKTNLPNSSITIDITNQPPGIYLINITFSGKIFQNKIVKL